VLILRRLPKRAWNQTVAIMYGVQPGSLISNSMGLALPHVVWNHVDLPRQSGNAAWSMRARIELFRETGGGRTNDDDHQSLFSEDSRSRGERDGLSVQPDGSGYDTEATEI
jgi:hypothetical protein